VYENGALSKLQCTPRHQIEKEGMTNLKKHKELKNDISQTLDFDDVYLITLLVLTKSLRF